MCKTFLEGTFSLYVRSKFSCVRSSRGMCARERAQLRRNIGANKTTFKELFPFTFLHGTPLSGSRHSDQEVVDSGAVLFTSTPLDVRKYVVDMTDFDYSTAIYQFHAMAH